MPGRLVAVHLGRYRAHGAEERDPGAQLDIARPVELLPRDRGQLAAAPQAWQRAGVGWGGRYTLTCSGTMGRAGSGITKCSGT